MRLRTVVKESLPDWLFRAMQAMRNGGGVSLHKSSLLKILPPDPVILEAGACSGEDTVELSKFWSQGEIHAFEPVPALYRSLLGRTKGRKNVYCYPLGLSGTSGWQQMHISGGRNENSSSLLAPAEEYFEFHSGITFSHAATVPTTTLSEWARNNDVRKIDFMWLDMQGGELEALASSPEIVRTATAIYSEVWLKRLYQGCPTYQEFREFMEAQGFVVSLEMFPYQDAGNVLFVRDPTKSL